MTENVSKINFGIFIHFYFILKSSRFPEVINILVSMKRFLKRITVLKKKRRKKNKTLKRFLKGLLCSWVLEKVPGIIKMFLVPGESTWIPHKRPSIKSPYSIQLLGQWVPNIYTANNLQMYTYCIYFPVYQICLPDRSYSWFGQAYSYFVPLYSQNP